MLTRGIHRLGKWLGTVVVAGCLPLWAAESAAPKAPAAAETSLSEKLAAQVPAESVKVEAIPGGAELRCDLQKLKGRVTPEGLTVESLSASEGRGAFTLRWANYGREAGPISESDQVRNGRNRSCVPLSLAKAVVTVDGNRVTVVRSPAFRRNPGPAEAGTPNSFTEEITTSGDGIRHDMLLMAPPSGSGELVAELALDGATAVASPTGVKVIIPGGRELTYDQLFDANVILR